MRSSHPACGCSAAHRIMLHTVRQETPTPEGMTVWKQLANFVAAAGLAACCACLLPSRALADAIDGEWCFGTSHFAIDGPNILTPGGNRIQGNYSRHGFTYVVPVNEAGAGGEVNMVLLNEEMVSLT